MSCGRRSLRTVVQNPTEIAFFSRTRSIRSECIAEAIRHCHSKSCCSQEATLPKLGSNGTWSGWQVFPAKGAVGVIRKFLTALSMHTLGSASLVCPYPSSVSKTALPRVWAASTEFAYLVLGSYRLPMTRIGFAVVAFHGPVYRFALGDCQEAHGAQSPYPSTNARKLLLVRCGITVGHVRTNPGGGWGLSAHCSAVADTNRSKKS